MKSLIIRDFLARKNVKRKEVQSLSLKYIIKNRSLSMSLRWECNLILFRLLSKSSQTSLRNRCFLSQRRRGYNRFFGLSRTSAREFCLNGSDFFIKKSSW